MDHKSEGFEAWVQRLPANELENRYRDASSNLGNSTDSESREYFGDLRHAYAEELEHRDYCEKMSNKLELRARVMQGINEIIGKEKLFNKLKSEGIFDKAKPGK